MGHGYSRPITRVITGVSEIYIPINRYQEDITVQVTSGGSTFTLDYTLDNIIRSQASSYDVAGEPLVAAASAFWTNLIASGAANAEFRGQLQAFALRVNLTIYVGDLTVRIAQAT